MKCPVCAGPMRPLFQSLFCPRDCDRPAAGTRREQGKVHGPFTGPDGSRRVVMEYPFQDPMPAGWRGWWIAGNGSAAVESAKAIAATHNVFWDPEVYGGEHPRDRGGSKDHVLLVRLLVRLK